MGTYVITEPCIDVKDGTCVEVCPVSCIHTTDDAQQYYIDPGICIECEQCALVCPVDAIYRDSEVPEEWLNFIEVNAAFFAEIKPSALSIAAEDATRAIAIAESYAQRNGILLGIAVVDASEQVAARRLMDGADPSSMADALERARQAVRLSARSRGSRPIFDRLTVVGAIGVAGGTADQDNLAARAGMSYIAAQLTHFSP